MCHPAGAHGLVEINKRLRADPGLQAAFGRQACAEQSVVQDTLDACTEANVTQMQQATDAIYRRHSWAYRHDYTRSLQVLDMDMTGMPCGKKAAFATKGYFANQRNRDARGSLYRIRPLLNYPLDQGTAPTVVITFASLSFAN